MPDDYTYPQELIKKTEARIRKQLDGNGVDQKQVSFAVLRQGVETFNGKTSFTLDSAISSTQSKGKQVQGRLIESGKLQSEIQSFVTGLGDNDAIHAIATDTIKKLPLNGFGVENTVIPLQNQKTTLTEHVKCGKCSGQGISQCHTCHGRGQMQCNICYGTGLKQCMQCNGQGQVQNGTNMQVCTTCHGRREVFCYQCHGQKVTPCSFCNAKGHNSCTECGGQGLNSTHVTITPSLKLHSDIMFARINTEAKNMVAKIGAVNLAKGGHITVTVGKKPIEEEVERAYFEDEPIDTNKNAVFYDVTVPWAVAELTINGDTDTVNIIGTKGAVANGGKFMDRISAYPLTILAKAARGDGYVAGLLKDACKYSVSRETLSAVASTNRKKAAAKIHQLYPVGMAKDTLHNLVNYSYQALKRITRRPRYFGLIAGLALSGGLNYSWFTNNMRKMTNLYDIPIRYALDAAPLAIGIILTIIMIKGAGYFAFQSVMKDIGIQTKKMPAVGTAGIYGLVGNIIIWGGLFTALIYKLY